MSKAEQLSREKSDRLFTRSGDYKSDSINSELNKAFEFAVEAGDTEKEAMAKISSSLRGRKLLNKVGDKWDSLEKEFTKKELDYLAKLDFVLDWLAEGNELKEIR